MYSSDSRTCRAIVLHIEETKNLPQKYNGRRASQRACTNEPSYRYSARYQWGPRSHEQEPASQFRFVVHSVLILLYFNKGFF